MISTKFNDVIRLAEKIRYVDEDRVKSLIILCNNVKVNRQSSTLKKIYELFCKISLKFPHEDYMLQIEITNKICEAFIEIGKLESKYIQKNFDGITFNFNVIKIKKFANFGDAHMFAIAMYSLLASKLEHLGITGELDNTLLKTKDPWVELYNRDSKKGNQFLQNEPLFHQLDVFYSKLNESNRQNLIGKYYLLFKNAITIGDINNQAIYYFNTIRPFVRLGKEASLLDIRFYTTYLELLLSKNDIGTTFRKVESILLEEFTVQMNLGEHTYCYEVAKTLAKVYKQKEWIEIALSLPVDDKHPADVYYLKIFKSIKEKKLYTNGQILLDLRNFLDIAKESYPTRIMLDLYKKKFSFVYLAALTYFYENKEWASLVEATYLWNGFNDSDDSKTDFQNKCILVSVLNMITGKALFVLNNYGEVTSFEAESKLDLTDIIKSKDLLENSWTALIQAPETLEFKEPSKMHIYTASDYTKKLSEFVEIEKLSKLLKESTNGPIEFIEVSWTNTPVVPLLDNLIESKIFALRSNEKLSCMESINKVLIWANPDGSLGRSQFECATLKILLEKQKINYEIYSGTECNKDLFLQKYADKQFDIIWIMSHGEFDYNNSPNSKIIISKDESVTTKELSEISINREDKRYLVLNACQSATSEVRYNSMGFTGIASSLTNSVQSVLGHLWSVDDLGSALLGSLIMKKLVLMAEPDLPLALKSASKVMVLGNEAIISELEEIDLNLEIIDRVRNTTEDFSNPFFSQSAMVFE
ncbi:CHAT domain-containing protein [Viridibacillus sp. FSL H8-0123]|uniref:CHAT domain-containing protein n=1 Tax=Viridibacillus sp. FSL H8-0123 TaxID=1928922 RepID=UPI00096DE08D|nr:CHAT domain-containing protein [Viridibacillus sp. FSL H8-0123]OMC83327.1 hypothetical protein BK130_07195 [Viridibacillus sp. FSL H8-0123]